MELICTKCGRQDNTAAERDYCNQDGCWGMMLEVLDYDDGITSLWDMEANR